MVEVKPIDSEDPARYNPNPVSEFEQLIDKWEFVDERQYDSYEVERIGKILDIAGKVERQVIIRLISEGYLPQYIDLLHFYDPESQGAELSSSALQTLVDLGVIRIQDVDPWEFRFAEGDELYGFLNLMREDNTELTVAETVPGRIEVSRPSGIAGINVNIGFEEKWFHEPFEGIEGKPKIQYVGITFEPEYYIEGFTKPVTPSEWNPEPWK